MCYLIGVKLVHYSKLNELVDEVTKCKHRIS